MTQQNPNGALSRLFEGVVTPAAAASTWPSFNFSSGMVDDPAPAGLANRVARQLSLDATGALRVNAVGGGVAPSLIDEASLVAAELVANGATTTAAATGVLGFLESGLLVSADDDGTLDVEVSSDDASYGYLESVDLEALTNNRSVVVPIPRWAEHVRVRNRAGADRSITVTVSRAR